MGSDNAAYQHQSTETDQDIIPLVIFQWVNPGAFCLAKAAQVHRVSHVFTVDDRVHGNRHQQRRDPGDLVEYPTLHLLNFVSPCLLGIQGHRQTPRQRGDKPDGKLHGVSHLIRKPQAVECRPIGTRIHWIINQTKNFLSI